MISHSPSILICSRKEPSALHRSPRSPSSASPSPSPNAGSNDINNGNGRSVHNRTDLHDVQQRLHDEADSGEEEEGEDIFLSGTGYWQADEMKSTQKNTHRATMDSTVHASHGKGVVDALDSSTINIGGEQWQQQRAEGQEELDEFELIERQLENSSLANTFGAVNKSLANSSHFHSSQANSATLSRPEPVKQKVDDWSDAYEHDDFAKTKNNQREGTQLQYSSHVYHKTDSNNYYGGGDADKDSEDEQYAEDFSGSDDEVAQFRSQEPHSSHRISTNENTVRQSVSDYIHSTSPPRQNHQEQEPGHDFEERSSKPSARPSYSKHWDGRPDSPTEDQEERDSYGDTRTEETRLHAAAPTMRATESPSWGRSTQPVRHSFSENEGAGSEQDDSRSGFASTSSRTAEGAKMARMSNSALRKISSRTAALHGQGQTPVSRMERPTLADDAQRNDGRDAFSDPEEEETAQQEVIYTRPTPVRRASGPAATLGVGAGTAKGATKPRSSSTGGRLRPGAMTAAGTASGGVDALSEKAQALEQELQTYR